MWQSFTANGSSELHLIYTVSKDGIYIASEDAQRTLSFIDDKEFEDMIGLPVLVKAERE